MTVAELISFLQTQPQDLQVAHAMYSEYTLLDKADIQIMDLCEARTDGWLHYKRPDRPTRQYLVFPGN